MMLLINMQSLIEELSEMEQQRGIIDHQRGPGVSRCLLSGLIFLLRKCDYGDVGCDGVLPQRGDGLAKDFEPGFKIDESQHRFFPLCHGHQVARRRHRLHAIAKILQSMDQLATGQEFLVEQKRKRLLHFAESELALLKMQKFFV